MSDDDITNLHDNLHSLVDKLGTNVTAKSAKEPLNTLT